MPTMKLSNIEIGQRYGKALFEFALEQKQENAILDELYALMEIYKQIPDLGEILTDARLQNVEKKQLLTKITDSASEIMTNFLQLLFEYRRLNVLPEIVTAYEKLYDKFTGTYNAHIIAAVELNAEQLDSLRQALKERLNAQKINLTTEVDKTIIGGLIVKVGGQIIDGSIASRIKKLRRVLLND